MTRSSKKNPVTGMTSAGSEKTWKADEHRRERRTVRQVIQAGGDDADLRLHRENWGNPWKGPKDGKTWCGGRPWTAHALRK